MANINVKNRIVVLATFNGKSGSLGYRRGERYLLTMETYANGSIVILPEKENNSSPKPCEYGSIIAFYNNWVNISKPGILEGSGPSF